MYRDQPRPCRSWKFVTGTQLFALLILPAIACSAPLRTGDFLMVTWGGGLSSCCQVVTMDPALLTASVLTSGGYIVDPQDIAVGANGDVYVTVPTTGVVRVDPISGTQSIFASVISLGGGEPIGIFVDRTEIYVTLRGSPARIVELDPNGAVARVVTSGGFLTYPAGLALGPDAALYVCETIPTGASPGGGLIRVDLVSGSQTLIASAEPLHGPFDAAFAPDGSLWSIQRSHLLHERRGVLVRTTVADGASEQVPFGFDYLSGVAVRSDGLTLLADCYPVHNDCEGAYVRLYPDGATIWGNGGPLAVVPDVTTMTTRASWGRLKLIYR